MLPTDFVFSQASLQDFVDCRRRFQYRYLMHLRWPALPAEPPESLDRLLQLGNAFHRLVHQHQLGISLDRLTSIAQADHELESWWQSYLHIGLRGLPEERHPEVRLRSNFAGWPVVGNYDLLAVDPGLEVVIVDWKTSRRLPHREQMQVRLQTRIYPALLVRSDSGFNHGEAIEPEMIRMRYWFPEFPDQPLEFKYDQDRFQQDVEMINELITRVAATEEAGFIKTEQLERCRFCLYRSLCDRGEAAGLVDSLLEDPLEVDDVWEDLFDFEQIAEVAW
jgi:hypothetical protein